jgi:hypothetical protein
MVHEKKSFATSLLSLWRESYRTRQGWSCRLQIRLRPTPGLEPRDDELGTKLGPGGKIRAFASAGSVTLCDLRS